MNAQNFTQKSLEAIQESQDMAIESQHMQIEQEHLLYALLKQDNSLISQLFTKMNIDTNLVIQNIKQLIESMPTELDEISRKIMQHEIEKAALKKETDKLSKEHFLEIQKELADVKSYPSYYTFKGWNTRPK